MGEFQAGKLNPLFVSFQVTLMTAIIKKEQGHWRLLTIMIFYEDRKSNRPPKEEAQPVLGALDQLDVLPGGHVPGVGYTPGTFTAAVGRTGCAASAVPYRRRRRLRCRAATR